MPQFFGEDAEPERVRLKREAEAAEAKERLQWQVFTRLHTANLSHARQAWTNRVRMPIAAHALVVAYQHTEYTRTDPETGEPDLSSGQPVVTAATRIWHDRPENEDPVPLIRRFTDIARDSLTPAGQPHQRHGEPEPVWDIRRTELMTRVDEAMAPDAVYLGLGYSTLNTEAGSFADACRRAVNLARERGHSAVTTPDIPGVFCYVSNPSGQLSEPDHRAFIAKRYADRSLTTVTIQSAGMFHGDQILAPFPYAPVVPVLLYEQSGQAEVMRALWWLDQAIRDTDVERRRAEFAAWRQQREQEIRDAETGRSGRRRP